MKTIAIFYGGRSYEHDISIITAIQVMTYLDAKKYKIVPVYMKDGCLYSVKNPQSFATYIDFSPSRQYTFIQGGLRVGLRRIKLDCALAATHGGEGENGVLQGILEYYGIPHTAPSAGMSAVGMNKWVSKAVFSAMGVPAVEGALLSDEDAVNRLCYPLIVKPVNLGSSIGIEMAHNEEELRAAVDTAKAFDDDVLVERALLEREELNCAAFAYQGKIIVSAIEKPVSWQEYLTFSEKYNNTGKVRAEKELPANIPLELECLVKNTTESIYRTLRLSGVVRMDYLYSTPENKLYINEINTIPGSLAYYLFSERGLPFAKLLDMIIEEAISKGAVKNISYHTDVLKQYISNNGIFKSSK